MVECEELESCPEIRYHGTTVPGQPGGPGGFVIRDSQISVYPSFGSSCQVRHLWAWPTQEVAKAQLLQDRLPVTCFWYARGQKVSSLVISMPTGCECVPVNVCLWPLPLLCGALG